MKRELERLILSQRGGHTARTLLGRIEEMSEAEVREWVLVITNAIDDAIRQGERRAARQPWR